MARPCSYMPFNAMPTRNAYQLTLVTVGQPRTPTIRWQTLREQISSLRHHRPTSNRRQQQGITTTDTYGISIWKSCLVRAALCVDCDSTANTVQPIIVADKQHSRTNPWQHALPYSVTFPTVISDPVLQFTFLYAQFSDCKTQPVHSQDSKGTPTLSKAATSALEPPKP